MENSIEEDIILLKDFTEGNFKRDKLENYKGSYKMGYFYYKDIFFKCKHANFYKFESFYTYQNIKMQIFHKTRIPFRGKPAFVLSHYLLLYFFRYSVSHLMTYHLIFISGTIIRTFLVITAHKTIIFILIQIDITIIFVTLFIICIVCTVFAAGSLHIYFSSLCRKVFLPAVLLII